MAEIEDTGIVDELLAEIKSKTVELNKFKEGNKSIVYFSSPFEVSNEDPLEVRGVFLTEGIWNNDFYPKEIAKKLAEQVRSRKIPVMVEHGKTAEFGSKPVGVTSEGEYNEIIKGILGRVEITDPTAKKMIKEKKLRGFSVRGEVEKQPENGKSVVEDFNLFEISLVEDPACDISFVAFSKELLNKLKEPHKEGKLMAEENIPVEKEVRDELAEIELAEGQVIALVVMTEEEAKEKKYPYAYGEPGKEKYELPKKKASKSLEELSEIVEGIAARIDEIEKKIGDKDEEEEEEKPKKKEEVEEKCPDYGEKKEAGLQEAPPEAEKKEPVPEPAPVAKTETPPTPVPAPVPAPAPEAVKTETPEPAPTPAPTPEPVPEPASTPEVKTEELEKLSPGEALVLSKKAKGEGK